VGSFPFLAYARSAGRTLPAALTILTTIVMASCTVGPDYIRPAAPVTPEFKEARKGWKLASPTDAVDRGPWWTIYRDPLLSSLLSQVDISNQTVAAAAAAYKQARALIAEAQAGYFPTVTNAYTVTGQGTSLTNGRATTVSFTPSANATWEVDVWGRIRRTVESDAAAAQVSAADLQNAKLSAQATLATAYFNLRASDSLKALLERTIIAYKKTLEITRNQYNGGTVSEADLVTAETQVLTVEAQAINVGVARAQYEHAIAVLIGIPPAAFSVPQKLLAPAIPHIPVSVPSVLLERRPDIAAAERLLQEDNALIGVAVANFYPVINLSALISFSGTSPISLATEAWSLVGSATQTVFDGGLRGAELIAAKATYEQAVATYRQTVLTAFQQVEDQLAAIRIYTREAAKEEAAVKAARKAVQVYLNQYQAGTVPFTTVVTAEATQLADEETALTIRQNLFVASVALIEALGGGWDTALLPPIHDLEKVPTLTPPL